MRVALFVVVAALVAPGLSFAQNGIVPNAMTDHTATRVDADVFGWSTDFTEMAAVALTTHRNARGGQRGQVLIVVWNVGSIEPIHSFEASVITAAELPHAPIPVPEAKDKLDNVDYNMGSQWPMRPKKIRPNGWMTVDTIWDPVKLGPNDCAPAVAFVVSNGEDVRFVPHTRVPDIKAPCDQLRMSHVRTYWAKEDLAAVMAKFDWSPDDHEISFRQPFAVPWRSARALRFLVRSDAPNDARTMRVVRALGLYGKVRVAAGSAAANSNSITTTPQLKLLGERFAKELGIQLASGPAEGDIDIVVNLRR